MFIAAAFCSVGFVLIERAALHPNQRRAEWNGQTGYYVPPIQPVDPSELWAESRAKARQQVALADAYFVISHRDLVRGSGVLATIGAGLLGWGLSAGRRARVVGVAAS